MTKKLTIEEKKEFIREKCVEANPEIKTEYRVHTLDENPPTTQTMFRSLGLADILLAFITKGSEYRTIVNIQASGQFLNTVTHMLGPYWNLMLPFEEQEEKVVEYIYALLAEEDK